MGKPIFSLCKLIVMSYHFFMLVGVKKKNEMGADLTSCQSLI